MTSRSARFRGSAWPAPAELAAGTIAFAAVGGLASENGGYFATTWGWGAVGLLGAAAILIIASGWGYPGRLELVAVVAVVGVAAWTFASAAWSESVTRSVLEGQRSLVYVGAVVAAILVDRRKGGRAVVSATWLAITAVCVYSLLTHLFPGEFGESAAALAQNRLSTPIGYWNGLGLFAGIGLLLALGLVARGGALVRVAASASTVVLASTLYFTFSRGAWIALLAGSAAAILVDRRRTQLVASALAALPWAGIGVFAASRADALTHAGASLAAAEKDGHALAVILLGLVTLAALSALVLDLLEERWEPATRVRRLFVFALACVLAAALAAGFARFGSPSTIARHAWNSFSSGASGDSNLNSRLFQLSSNGRVAHWRVAWREYDGHRWLGTGAGTYGEHWFENRPPDKAFVVHDAHNLYLETLAETGPVGLAFVVLLLGAPLVAAIRSRSPLAAVAAGVVVAFALHAAVDWDWELPALLVAALFPAFAVLGDARHEAPRFRRRLAPAVVLMAVGAFALVGLLGNIALARSGNASDATNWRQAESEARSAMDLAPWSAEPWRKLAVAQVGLGQVAAARNSLLEAVRIEPNDWSLWYQLSEVSTGALHRRAAAQVARLNPHLNGGEATPGDLRLVVIP